ncbi:MAG TPA: glycoside hydrolase family 2 TIM barrel-domain containing protein, partial [Polyangia bacterium]|nr:glycoside hydrolase family 2 TIM barrel-domain containing protein [Polyangia bacterium]
MSPLRVALLLCAGIAATAAGRARAATPEPSALAFADGRGGVSLDGAWHVIIDPYDNGSLDYRSQPRPHGYFDDARPRDKSDLVEYDFARSPTLQVPGDWNTQRPDLLYYEGTIWYERRFDAALHEGNRAFVQFGAAAQRATVWLNGKRLGDHEGGFTPFAFEVTGIVRARDNSIVVKVDNTRRAEALPALNTDWWNYGGLTRGVRLIETPRTFIRAARVQLAREEPPSLARRVSSREGSGTLPGFPSSVDQQDASLVRGTVRLDGARAPVTVTIEIPDAHARHTVTTDESGQVRFAFVATLAPWSPESPRLYDVVVRAGDDRVTDRIGFRTIRTQGPNILLNGKPIFLRGISMHEEALGRGGRATTRAEAEALLGLAKELGCNFVRLAHYPHGEEMTRAADRLGLLVWSEIPVYWTIAWSNVTTLAAARAQLAEEIARDGNRASVVLWSVGNETP